MSLTPESLAAMQSAEAPLITGLSRLGLRNLQRAGFNPGPVRGTSLEVAERIISIDEAERDFEKFALMTSLSLDRSGEMIPTRVIDVGIAQIAEDAGKNIRFKDNEDSQLIYGIYYAQTYLRAMINCDNNPAKFIKILEQNLGEVEDFRLEDGQILKVLETYPGAKAMFEYLTDPKVIYELQNGVAGSYPPMQLRVEYERVMGEMRTPGQYRVISARAGHDLNLTRFPGESLSQEAELQLGYALVEAIGWGDAVNHRRVVIDAAGHYVWARDEVEDHIYKAAPMVADPFSAAARPREFVELVKQKFGTAVSGAIGLDVLDVGWRTYGAEILKRSAAYGRSVIEEMEWEADMSQRMKQKDPMNPLYEVRLPAGATIGGRLPTDPRINYEETKGRYPDGTVINGVDVGGQEIYVGMIRNIKKHHKASDLWAAMYGLYLNPYGKTDETLVKAVEAAGEYAREAFGPMLSKIQREQIVPKITSAVMKVAAKRGVPVNQELIERTVRGMQTDLAMFNQGLGGWLRRKHEKAKMSAYNAEAKARAREMAPGKGEALSNDAVAFVKLFWGGK